MKERLLISFSVLTVAAIVMGVMLPNRVWTVASLWALIVFGIVLLELNGQSRRLVGPEPRLESLLETHERERAHPEDLKRLERGLGWMAYEPSYFDFRVRPLLRELTCHLALERRGLDLYDDPTAGRGMIDPELLNLIGDRKATEIYGMAAITTDDLARMVAHIEAI